MFLSKFSVIFFLANEVLKKENINLSRQIIFSLVTFLMSIPV
jgi:hypothetical protein